MLRYSWFALLLYVFRFIKFQDTDDPNWAVLTNKGKACTTNGHRRTMMNEKEKKYASIKSP